jgi:hypothetical protein
MIPTGGKTDLRFHFRVMPPVSEKGQSFKADIAIIDLFGNEHWIKGIEFPYSKRLQYWGCLQEHTSPRTLKTHK